MGWFLTAILVAATGMIPAVPAARADGGVVRIRQAAGPFEVTVFTSPTPLRAGPVDISVMVGNRARDQPVLDAEVSILVVSLDGASSISADAIRENATNKLLYAALLELPHSGRWRLGVGVRHDGNTAEVTTDLSAAPPRPPLLFFWPYLVLPAVAIAMFGLHQWLSARPAVATERQ